MITGLMNRNFDLFKEHYMDVEPQVNDLIFSENQIYIVRARVHSPGQSYPVKMNVIVDEYPLVAWEGPCEDIRVPNLG